MSESTNGAKWSGKKLRTVEALMAQGMGKQRRLESYDAKHERRNSNE